MTEDRITRITLMEQRMNMLIAWLGEDTALTDDIAEAYRALNDYYSSGDWRSDYEADENGGLPDGLPRGVLSQDGLYDVLTEFEEKIRDSRHPMTYEEAAAFVTPGRYRHFKGNEYEVIGIARHSETSEPMVVYRALYGEGGLWTRPANMWNETVCRDGRIFKRFERIEP